MGEESRGDGGRGARGGGGWGGKSLGDRNGLRGAGGSQGFWGHSGLGVLGGSRWPCGVARNLGGGRSPTYRPHDAHDALPQQPRVNVIGALPPTLRRHNRGWGPLFGGGGLT